MKYTYAVLGGGRQGTAAAYDMARFGDAEKVLIADVDRRAAEASARRVNDLLQTSIASAVELDVADEAKLEAFLAGVDSFLSAVPYWFNHAIILRIRAVGEKGGRPAESLIEVIDYYDDETGFTAMGRTTGFDGAIVAIMNARGQTPRGVHPVETGVPAALFVEEMKKKRGFPLTEKVTAY